MFMRKIIPLLLAAAIPLVASAAPRHKLTTIENAVEMMEFEIRLDAQNRGQLTATPCDQCAPVKLSIDASTRVTRDGSPLALEALNAEPVQPATLFYLPESGHITRITLWH